MQIELENIGKKYNRDWIFRNFNYSFLQDNSYAITGSNGSGKSTLLQIISGFIIPTEGVVKFNNIISTTDNFGTQTSICAPYLELIEEMTAVEFFNFHLRFKPLINNLSIPQILEIVQLTKAANKQIRYYSSGMKQRLKLAQAFFSQSSILLLDEPCSNLDKDGINLYHTLIKEFTNNRLIIICSNDEMEYSFCKCKIDLNTL